MTSTNLAMVSSTVWGSLGLGLNIVLAHLKGELKTYRLEEELLRALPAGSLKVEQVRA